MILMKYFHGSLAVLYPLSISLFKTENFESLNFFAYLRFRTNFPCQIVKIVVSFFAQIMLIHCFCVCFRNQFIWTDASFVGSKIGRTHLKSKTSMQRNHSSSV